MIKHIISREKNWFAPFLSKKWRKSFELRCNVNKSFES